MKSPKGLFVWEASIDLAVRMISLGDSLMARRRFAIADQITRSAISVPSNIAEAEGRFTKKDGSALSQVGNFARQSHYE